MSSAVLKHKTYQTTVDMDKEERKTINQGQEDEMVTGFYNLFVKCEEFIFVIYYSREVEKYTKQQQNTKSMCFPHPNCIF